MARGTMSAVLTLTVALIAVACAPPVPLVELTAGEAGGTGPCGMTHRDLAPPFSSPYPISVFEPTGEGAPWTGGSCSDPSRPTVLVAHGYLGVDPLAYYRLIEHLTSVGFLVIFAPYQIAYDPVRQYSMVDQGVQHAVDRSPRADTSRFGVIGHSYGGGMTPYLLQQATARKWGADSIWTVMFAPHFAALVGDGMIDLPDWIRSLIVTYEHDVLVDARIAIETQSALDVPADRKHHLMVLTDASHTPPLMADHLGPIAFPDNFLAPLPLGNLRADHFDLWAAWRPIDATARCSMTGEWCDTDLADMGEFRGGRAVKRGLVDADIVDRGPITLQECGFMINERSC